MPVIVDRCSAQLIGPFAAAAAVHVLVNHGLLWGMLLAGPAQRDAGQRAGAWSPSLLLLLASDLGYAALGLVIAALWPSSEFSAALVLVPLFVARWAMGQFAEQQRAYAATMPRSARRWRPRTSTPGATASGCPAGPG